MSQIWVRSYAQLFLRTLRRVHCSNVDDDWCVFPFPSMGFCPRALRVQLFLLHSLSMTACPWIRTIWSSENRVAAESDCYITGLFRFFTVYGNVDALSLRWIFAMPGTLSFDVEGDALVRIWLNGWNDSRSWKEDATRWSGWQSNASSNIRSEISRYLWSKLMNMLHHPTTAYAKRRVQFRRVAVGIIWWTHMQSLNYANAANETERLMSSKVSP